MLNNIEKKKTNISFIKITITLIGFKYVYESLKYTK